MGLLDLFRPKWKHSDPDVRIAAASEVSDENILIEMASQDREWFVRHNVFDVLRSRDCGQHVFAHLARHSRDEEIRRKAIKKLTDQAVLQDVAANDKYRYIRDAAEHRLEELRENVWGETQQAQSAKTAN